MISVYFHISSQKNPKQTNNLQSPPKPQTWMPNHLKKLTLGRYGFDDCVGQFTSSRVPTYSTATQNKCTDIGTETKISGLKLKIKIQAKE